MASSPIGAPGPKDLDDAYHEYLWGEPSPRSFARRAKFVGGMKKGVSLGTDVGADLGVAR